MKWMKLDEKLVHLRKEKGLTQLELAEAVNVSRQAVSKWESGGGIPSTENLRGLSELYGVPVDYLLNEEERKPENGNAPKDEPGNSPETVLEEKRKAPIKWVVVSLLVLFIGGAIMADKSSFSLYGVYQADGIVAGPAIDSGEDLNASYYVFRPDFAYVFSTENTAPLNVPITIIETAYEKEHVEKSEFLTLGFQNITVPDSTNIEKYCIDPVSMLYLVDGNLWLYTIFGSAAGGVPRILQLKKVPDEVFENLFGVGNVAFEQIEKESRSD